MDPLTAFAAVKSAISAGKQLHSMTKDIVSLFDAVDGAKSKHAKKKASPFASANEEAMDTFMRQQQALDVEEQLKELITQTRGFSAYQDLLGIRRQIRIDRKEAARLERIAAEERQQAAITAISIILGIALIIGAAIFYLWYLGWVDF